MTNYWYWFASTNWSHHQRKAKYTITQIQTSLVGFTCCDPSDWEQWCSSTSASVSDNSKHIKNASNTCKIKTGIKCTCSIASQVLWHSSTLASIYLCQPTKQPQNATTWKLQPIIRYRPKKMLIYYKLTTLWLLLFVHVAARLRCDIIIATVWLHKAMGYKSVISPILREYPIYSPS